MRGKVFIDSASDLYKLGIYEPSYDELVISASICGITMKPDIYEYEAETQANRRSDEHVGGDAIGNFISYNVAFFTNIQKI